VRVLALAIHHAHQNGVIHRDLKPANVLLVSSRVVSGERSEAASTTHDSPLTAYQPKITDFGLARQLDVPADISYGGQIIGTPSYMAPEQAGRHAAHTSAAANGAKAPAAGPAIDIYGLGAILYELLTGRPPFQGLDPLHTLLQVRHHEPVPPSRLQPKVSRDLETICLKCLDKQPLRRYASAEALAADLERFLKGEPIQARPVGTGERLWRWCRRNPLVAGLSVIVAVLLLIATAAGVVVAYHQTQLAAELRTKNLALEEANLRESAARAAAERSAADAQAKFTLARKAVDDLLHTLADDLSATQDIPRVRHKMLREALTIYQQFLEEKGNDPAVRQRTAEAYHQVGVIQSELGQSAEAEASARQAVAIAEKLAADFPTIAAYRHDLATYHTAMSDLFRNQQRQAEAEAAVRQALRLRQELIGSQPAYLPNRNRLAVTYQALGTVLWDQQKWAEAEDAFRQAVVVDERLLDEGKDPLGSRLQLANSCNKLGMMLGSRGRLDEADGYIRRAASLFQQEAEAFPDAPHVRHLWAEALYNRGGVALSRKDFAAAEQVLHQALSINEKLVADFPTWPAYATTLAGGYCSQGHRLRAQDQCEAALLWYARAIQAAEQVLARDARHADAARFLSLACLGRAQALEQLGRHAEAAQDWERMLARYSGPDRWHYRLLHARSLARAGDHAKASALADELASDNNLSPTAFYNLACVYALSVATLKQDAHLADRYAVRAVVLLRQAGDAVSPMQVLTDADLDSLRGRADFRALIEERQRQP